MTAYLFIHKSNIRKIPIDVIACAQYRAQPRNIKSLEQQSTTEMPTFLSLCLVPTGKTQYAPLANKKLERCDVYVAIAPKSIRGIKLRAIILFHQVFIEK